MVKNLQRVPLDAIYIKMQERLMQKYQRCDHIESIRLQAYENLQSYENEYWSLGGRLTRK